MRDIPNSVFIGMLEQAAHDCAPDMIKSDEYTEIVSQSKAQTMSDRDYAQILYEFIEFWYPDDEDEDILDTIDALINEASRRLHMELFSTSEK